MVNRIYTLKRATPRMKYHHMNMVLQFREDLRDSQGRGMTEGTREYMLSEIERIMGRTEKFHKWFDGVYVFRRNNDMPTYEKKIRNKYRYLRRVEKKRATPPQTDCGSGQTFLPDIQPCRGMSIAIPPTPTMDGSIPLS